MADPAKILNDPNYVNANLATKQAIFSKHVASSSDYKNANAATKAAIQARFGLTAEAAPATLGEDIVSGFQAPFKKLAETVSADYQRRSTATAPKSLGEFVKGSIQDITGTAQVLGGIGEVLTAPIQAGARAIAGQVAQLPLQAYSPATASVGKTGVQFNAPVPLNYEQTKAQTETGLLTALSAVMPGAGQIAKVAQTASIGASPQARAALSGMAQRPVPRTAAPVVAAPEAAPIVTAAEAAAPEAGRVFQAGERFGAKGSVGAASLEEAAIREQRAAELPIPVELASYQKSRNFADQQRARELAKNSEVGEPIRQQLSDQQETVRQNFEQFVEGTGSNIWNDPYAKGSVLSETVKKFAASEKTRMGDLFKKAREAGELREPIGYAPLKEFLDAQTETTKTTLAPVLKHAEELLAQEDPTGSGVISLNALEDIRRSINKVVQPGTPNSVFGKDLKALIDQATENAGGDVYKAARKARVKYREDFEDISLVNQIMGTKKNSADRVVAHEKLIERILSTTTPVDSLKHVKSIMDRAGPDGAQAWRELQGATYEYIRDQAYKNIAKDEQGNINISPDALNKAIKTLESGGKMDILLGKQGAELMRTVNLLTQDLFTAPPGSVNNSNTSSALLNALDKVAMYAASNIPVAGKFIGPILSPLRTQLTKNEVQKLIKTDRPAQPTLTQEPPQ
jgi:hypothetical protein